MKAFYVPAVALTLAAPVFAAVTVASFVPSQRSPQPIGKAIAWTATALDTQAGPLTFRFNIRTPGASKFVMVKDFNLGTLNGTIWTSLPFVWVPTGVEGAYQLQVVIKDFTSGETSSRIVPFTVSPVAIDGPAVVPTDNPLVFLYSVPACPAGSMMRALFQQQAATQHPITSTNWTGCHPPATQTFEIAGMLPSTMYKVWAQTKSGTHITSGSLTSLTTGPLPGTVPFPTFSPVVSPADKSNPVILHNMITFGGSGVSYPDVATDLAGHIIWYYYSNDLSNADVLLRPLQGGGFITLQNDHAWDPSVTKEQLLRQTDLAGNIVRETNMGIIQQQLVAMGAVNGNSCRALPSPPPVGSGCVGSFHHDAIQTLPNGDTAVLVDVEKIFPPGVQGDRSGLPVDIIGDMIIVLDNDWQVKWYWDSFDPAHGGWGYARLPVNRTAVLAETCGTSTSGCPPVFLLGPNIAPLAHDWLHGNTLYYWPNSGGTTKTTGDLIWSSRNQDWLFKIDYQDGQGTGNIAWRMGPSGDFTFLNTFNDPWPWFSHQHDAGIENNGTGVMTIFDNGNTRVSQPSLSTGGVPGLGSNCGPHDCNSRGMAITFNENNKTVNVAPDGVTFDLGYFSPAMGSGNQLENGNYFFENPLVVLDVNNTAGYSMELAPTPPVPQLGAARVLVNVKGPEHYRGWQMPNLYFPPTT